GKAYREIAAGTSDYHEVIKKLLPDPQRELFERVIRTLRELDQSTNDLNGLEEKQRYLESLDKLITQIADGRQTALRYQWLIHHLNCENLTGLLAVCQAGQATAEGELGQCKDQISAAQREDEELRRQLSVLQQADASGLLNIQRDRQVDEERLRGECTRKQSAVKEREQEHTAAERANRDALQVWQTTLKRVYDTLHRLRGEVPFSISPLLSEIDAQQRIDDVSAATEITFDSYQSQAQQALMKLNTEESDQERTLIEHHTSLNKIEEEISTLTAQEEIMPVIAGFREACQLLQRQMIDAVPLYRALEWKPGLSGDTRTAIEEAIGPAVLGTMLVSAENYATAAQLIFPAFPGIRLVNQDEERADPPEWMRASFDYGESQPAAIRVLAEEMSARTGQHPSVQNQHGAIVLHFRSHQRSLRGAPVQLIGAERRRDALRQQIKLLQEKKKVTERDIRTQEKTKADLQAHRLTLEALDKELRAAPLGIAKAQHTAQTAQGQLADAGRRQADIRTEYNDIMQSWQQCKTQLADLQERINNEGLDKLKEKLQKVQKDIEKVKAHISELHRGEGVISERIAEKRRQYEALVQQLQLENGHLQNFEAHLAPHAAEVESVAYYVLRTWRGQQFTRVENVRDELERVIREEAETIGGLRRDINHATYGSTYAFNYTEATNILVDRHMSTIHDVVIAGQRQIDEQREVINERTQELIKNIIMGDLFTELKRSVSQLRTMVRKINNLLTGRVFGSNRYRFRLEEERRYHDLLQVIEHYNPLDPSAQDELKHFLEVHKDEIMATEVNDIPATLDYRNWFHYELAMVSENDAGEVVMSRKTKSLGSGGEQAVPNYLLILTVAHFLYDGNDPLRHRVLLFDEAFYGIDASRRDQLLGFASDLGLQLFVASPDLDGVKQEIPCSTTLLVVKDDACNIHLFPCDYTNLQQLLLGAEEADSGAVEFSTEIGVEHA
ncbi:MAG: SbcC/MukB-like Walker B domain-containing protein, partial [bacterium]